jgi:hypothetical protein
MPLCAKCLQREATTHLTTVVGDAVAETVHLCAACASSIGLPNPSAKELASMSVIGRQCEFCGQDAFSGVMPASGAAVYWCFDCGRELGQIQMELLASEKPGLLERIQAGSSFLSLCCDPDFRAWSEESQLKAFAILTERRRAASGGRETA